MTEATTIAKPVNPIVAFKRLTEKRASLVEAIAVIDTQLEQYAGLKEQAEKDAAFRATIEAGLAVGTRVTYEFGRAATRVTKIGVVKAFKAAADKVPAQYRIESGEGFDAVIDTVPASAIVDFPQSPEPGTPVDTPADPFAAA